MEELTGNKVTVEQLKKEIISSNETRKLLHRLYDLRKREYPPISGLDMIKVMQKQYVLSAEDFKEALRTLINEAEQTRADSIAGSKDEFTHRPRIMISGCPMPGGSTKVPEIIENRGGLIVVEESCTGTRSFWDLVDENKDPMTALAERYIKIPCSCMTPNDRRIDNILELAREFKVDGVVNYTLQFCHGYNIERYKVQQALKNAGIPVLSIETDYSDSDVEQIGLRVDAFMEMLS